jgi:HEAT repeat protein
MNWLLQSPVAETLGGVLLHFFWQGTLIAIALRLALWILGRGSAVYRYLACCTAMLAMAAAPSVLLIAALAPSAPPVTGAPVTSWPPRVLPYSAAVEPLVHSRLGSALPWIVAVWVVGVLVLSARAFSCWLAAQRLSRRKVSVVPSAIHASTRRIARSMGWRGAVVVVQSALAEVPAVVGWMKPVILIPAGLITGLTASQLEYLIAHEIAHIRRRDYLVNLVQTAIETLLFYHPAVWWTSRQIRLERENCCDDLAVCACGDVIGYARALAELERIRGAEPKLAVAASGGQLLPRIRRLVLPSSSSAPAAPVFALCLAVLILAVTVFTRPAGAQSPDDRAADTLFAQLHARDWAVEGEVKRLLGEVQASGNIQPFLNVLHSRRDWQTREKAAWVLGMAGNANAVEGLSASLRDESPSVRHTAAWALGRIGDARAIDVLAANLNDSSAEARSGAVWALGSIGEPRAVDTVIRALTDPDPDVRTAAAWALGAIGDLRAETALQHALEDHNAEVRKKAAESLARLHQ